MTPFLFPSYDYRGTQLGEMYLVRTSSACLSSHLLLRGGVDVRGGTRAGGAPRLSGLVLGACGRGLEIESCSAHDMCTTCHGIKSGRF